MALRRGITPGLAGGVVLSLPWLFLLSTLGDACTVILCSKSKQNNQRGFLYHIFILNVLYSILITRLYFLSNPPDGRLIQLLSRPSLMSRLFLKWPLRFLTCGFSWYIWWIMMFSSLSTMSISRSANSCSRLFNSSSCILCSSAARASSSSQERSSCVFKIVFYLCLRIIALHRY